jgi:hypothetical protein
MCPIRREVNPALKREIPNSVLMINRLPCPFTLLQNYTTPVFSYFYQKIKLAKHDSRCMMEVTEEELGLRQSPRRSLTTAYFVQESLVACGAARKSAPQTGKIVKTTPRHRPF